MRIQLSACKLWCNLPHKPRAQRAGATAALLALLLAGLAFSGTASSLQQTQQRAEYRHRQLRDTKKLQPGYWLRVRDQGAGTVPALAPQAMGRVVAHQELCLSSSP